MKGKKFKELIFSSQTSKMIRHTTVKTNDLSEKLAIHEESLASSYEPFSSMIVKEFCSWKNVWDIYINAIAKIDVLMSMAKTCSTMVPRCLPIFT